MYPHYNPTIAYTSLRCNQIVPIPQQLCRLYVFWEVSPIDAVEHTRCTGNKIMTLRYSSSAKVNFLRSITLGVFLVATVVCAPASGDQVIVGSDPDATVFLADDVLCSACDGTLTPQAIEVLTSGAGGEVTAGQLWSFFKAQGVDSMDELTLRLDVDPEKAGSSIEGSSIDISALQLQIENPSGIDGFATDVKIGDKQLLLSTPSFDPDVADMQLAVKLHYDFMERFSADSTEKIKLNVSGSGLMPSISIAKKTDSLRQMNWLMLVGFAIFWLSVFGIVNWLTKPSPAGTSVTNKTAVSS